jgi:hypothetical protein
VSSQTRCSYSRIVAQSSRFLERGTQRKSESERRASDRPTLGKVNETIKEKTNKINSMSLKIKNFKQIEINITIFSFRIR